MSANTVTLLKSVSKKVELLNGGAILKYSKQENLEFTLSCISFKNTQNLILFLVDINGIQIVNKIERAKEKFTFENTLFDGDNFSCAIFYDDEKEFYPLNFGYQGQFLKLSEITSLYEKSMRKADKIDKDSVAAQNLLLLHRQNEKEPNDSPHQEVYDDEAVAEENYYLFNSENTDKGSDLNEGLHNQTCNSNGCKEQAEQEEKNANRMRGNEDEKCAYNKQDNKNFFAEINEKLEDIFCKYPPISALTALIPDSKWAEIPYGKNDFFTVGVIYENQEPKYVVHGALGEYTKKPKKLESYAKFIPLSIFDCHGKGYWCIFQCARTGEKIL